MVCLHIIIFIIIIIVIIVIFIIITMIIITVIIIVIISEFMWCDQNCVWTYRAPLDSTDEEGQT